MSHDSIDGRRFLYVPIMYTDQLIIHKEFLKWYLWLKSILGTYWISRVVLGPTWVPSITKTPYLSLFTKTANFYFQCHGQWDHNKFYNTHTPTQGYLENSLMEVGRRAPIFQFRLLIGKFRPNSDQKIREFQTQLSQVQSEGKIRLSQRCFTP